MPNILKKFINPNVEVYRFPEAEELIPEPEELQTGEETLEQLREPRTETPVDFAQLQAEAILQDAHRQADELVAKARQEAEDELKQLQQQAREAGYRAGYAEGMAEGLAEGLAQARQQQERNAAELEAEVSRFLERAAQAQESFMEQTTDELRDLSVAIAEKVVRVSLKSSGEIISRMILSAIEKRKRKEWVHVYIAGCDAKTMAEVPPALTAALSGLSDRVRIIPMADDESGTCIVEMPDEIVDASVSTQFANLKTMLEELPRGQSERKPSLRPDEGVSVCFER